MSLSLASAYSNVSEYKHIYFLNCLFSIRPPFLFYFKASQKFGLDIVFLIC
jgi:hypothetical protein